MVSIKLIKFSAEKLDYDSESNFEDFKSENTTRLACLLF